MLHNTGQFEGQATLTERQKSYLDCYKKEKSAAKTAKSMGVAIKTAEEQLRSIAHKLGLNTIREIVQKETDASDKKATASQLMGLIERQGFKCAMSGMELSPKVAEIDHIIPRSKGGSDEISNLQWVHKKINRMKGNITNEMFIELCRLVANNHAPTPYVNGSQSSLN